MSEPLVTAHGGLTNGFVPDVALGHASLVIVPTYNERDNLIPLVSQVLEILPQSHVLIVDDNSPDGTGRLADSLAETDTRILVLHRPAKQGIGRAYLAGFHMALETDAQYIFEMDADFSHDPSYLPSFLSQIADCDVVIGSRYVRGGGVRNWGVHRRLISGAGNAFARTVLGLPVRDCTAGFRCYRRTVLEALNLQDIHSEGYAFQVEMVFRSSRHGFRIREFPIVFPDRVHGQSKMSKKILMEGLWFVARSRLGRL